MYIRSLNEPNMIIGGLVRVRVAIASLSVLAAGLARNGEGAGQAHLVFEEGADAAHIGLVGDDGEACGGEEVLRHRAPQIPQRLQRRVLLAGDEGLGVKPEDLAERAQEGGGRLDAEGGLQIGPVKDLAEQPPEFAVEADIGIGIGKLVARRRCGCRAGRPC